MQIRDSVSDYVSFMCSSVLRPPLARLSAAPRTTTANATLPHVITSAVVSDPDPNMPPSQRKLVDIMQNFKDKLSSLDESEAARDELLSAQTTATVKRRGSKPKKSPLPSPITPKSAKNKGNSSPVG